MRHRRSWRLRGSRFTARFAAAAVICLVVNAEDALGQLREHSSARTSSASPAVLLAGSALLGSIAASIRCVIEECDVSAAAVRGGVGGLLAFAGRAVAAQEFDGAGLLGRQVSAVGIGFLETPQGLLPDVVSFRFPALVVRASNRDGTLRLKPAVDASGILVAAYFVARSDVGMNWSRTLSAGTFVLEATGTVFEHDGEVVNGAAVSTTILLSELSSTLMSQTLRHESVHVLQLDLLSGAVFAPVERWLARRMGLAGVTAHVEVNLLRELSLGATAVVLGDRLATWPFELEANTLVTR